MIGSGHGAVIESALPGRVRFRFPQDERQQGIIEDAESALRGLKGVLDVTANLFTGSLLVTHDPAVLPESLLVDFARNADILAGIGEDGEPEPAVWSETSQIAGSIVNELKRLDRTVSRVSRGTIDGKTAAAILLFGTSLTRALFDRRQVRTPWYALLWYAYSLFIQWNKNNGSSSTK